MGNGDQLKCLIVEMKGTPYRWVDQQTKPQHEIWDLQRCIHVRVHNNQLYHRYKTAVRPMMLKLNGMMMKHLNADGKMPSGTNLEDLLDKTLREFWLSEQTKKGGAVELEEVLDGTEGEGGEDDADASSPATKAKTGPDLSEMPDTFKGEPFWLTWCTLGPAGENVSQFATQSGGFIAHHLFQ